MPQQHQKEEDEALPGGGNAKDALNGISRTNKLTVSNGVSFIYNITEDYTTSDIRFKEVPKKIVIDGSRVTTIKGKWFVAIRRSRVCCNWQGMHLGKGC